MTTKKIVFVANTPFTEVMQAWSSDNGLEFELHDSKTDMLELAEGLAIFHENHNFSKETEELRDLFDKSNKPVHKVDINGTLVATTSNLLLWMERERLTSLLVLGNPELAVNENLKRFLDKLVATDN